MSGDTDETTPVDPTEPADPTPETTPTADAVPTEDLTIPEPPPEEIPVSAADPPPSEDPTQPASHYIADILPAMERPPVRFGRVLGSGDVAIGKLCNVCDGEFKEGASVEYVLMGPGADSRQQERALQGRVYDAIWLLCCTACIRGS